MTHHSDLNFLEDLFLHTASLCLWRFSPSFELEYSNSLTVAPLKNIFTLSSSFQYMQEHFSEKNTPVFLFDDLFFLWAAVPESVNDSLHAVYLLGPVFSSTTSDSYVKEKMDIQNMSVKSQKTLLDIIEQIPVMPTAFFSHYICQLYYTLNGISLSTDQICMQTQTAMPVAHKKKEEASAKHDSYFLETQLLKNIEDGVLFSNFSSLFASAQIGLMCPGDPTRQKKDEAISSTTLFTRAAIRSGVPAETAYNLSDYYIQSVEAARTITEVIQITETMYSDIVRHIQAIRQSTATSSLVRDCQAYIDSHLTEAPDFEQLARELGYTKYYLTTRFKKESGMTISEYLMSRRIDYAKTLLNNPYMNIQEISESLHFSTPSHFSSVFRKLTGMTPTEYRKTLH